jgi:hypothetical protein
MFSPYHLALPAFLLWHSLQQSLLPCAALIIELDLKSIDIHKFLSYGALYAIVLH